MVDKATYERLMSLGERGARMLNELNNASIRVRSDLPSPSIPITQPKPIEPVPEVNPAKAKKKKKGFL